MTVRMSWHGDEAKRAGREGAARGLQKAAEHLLEEANRLVPIEEGTLLRSGVADVDEGELRASVSYDTPYSVKQHEDLTLQHDAGRQGKYLEQPLNEAKADGTVDRIIGAEVKKALDS